MNKPRTDIIDIKTIEKPIVAWWDMKAAGYGLDIEIIYPNGWREQYCEVYGRWEKAKTTQKEFEFNLVAWQYI